MNPMIQFMPMMMGIKPERKPNAPPPTTVQK
jgi:hypothetical protein